MQEIHVGTIRNNNTINLEKVHKIHIFYSKLPNKLKMLENKMNPFAQKPCNYLGQKFLYT